MNTKLAESCHLILRVACILFSEYGICSCIDVSHAQNPTLPDREASNAKNKEKITKNKKKQRSDEFFN